MKVGYARTSTVEQKAGLLSQVGKLKEAGCEMIFQEQASAAKQRDKLEEAINYLRQGETLVVTKIDRLARSVSDLNKIIERLKKKSVDLKILNIGLDTADPTGKMMLTMLAAVAEFERDIMLERQKEGIARAKELGKYKGGRKPIPQELKNTVINYVNAGASKVWTSKKVGLGVASVYRIIREYKNSL